METLMIVIFAIGVGYAVLSAVFGDVFGLEFHAGELPYLSPTIIAVFLTFFGGVGYILLHHTGLSVFLVAGLLLMTAAAVSCVLLFVVVIPLYAAQKGTALSAKEMIGCEAQVITSIETTRLGEIVYEQGGTRHSAPVKALEGAVIPQGSHVRIIDELAGTFVVKRI